MAVCALREARHPHNRTDRKDRTGSGPLRPCAPGSRQGRAPPALGCRQHRVLQARYTEIYGALVPCVHLLTDRHRPLSHPHTHTHTHTGRTEKREGTCETRRTKRESCEIGNADSIHVFRTSGVAGGSVPPPLLFHKSADQEIVEPLRLLVVASPPE